MVGVLQPLLRFWSGKWIRAGSLDSGQSCESHIRIIFSLTLFCMSLSIFQVNSLRIFLFVFLIKYSGN